MVEFDPSKRRFSETLFKGVVVAAVAAVVPEVVLNAASKYKETPPEKELTVEDYLVEIEKVPYNPEHAPEFLKKYAKEFKNWREVVESQRTLASDFLNSDFVRNSLLAIYKEAYLEKSEEDRIILADKLIADRKENYSKTQPIVYKKMKNRLGVYFPKLKKIVLDTISNTPHPYTDMKEGNYETKTVDLFVPLHEFWHSATLPVLIPAVVFDKILIYLAQNGIITEKRKNRHIKWAIIEEDETRKETLPDAVSSGELGYFQSPNEIYAFMMHIRGNLHIVSQYNPQLVKFDMFKDKFTQEHLVFLKKNQDKIFSNINKFEDHGGSMVEVTKNIFTKQLENFKDAQFVDLMNTAV